MAIVDQKPHVESGIVGVDVHGLHKSATMFLFKFFRHLSWKIGWEFYSANNDPPNPLLPDHPPLSESFCRCPLRSFVASEPVPGTQQRRVFQVRDPRDVLVSEYFSLGWIHPTNESRLAERREQIQQMSIDEYVLTQDDVSEWPLTEKYIPLLDRELDHSNEVIVTYEEMVTRFSGWVEKVLPLFGYRYPRLAAMKWAFRYRNEFRISKESMTHKRSIQPGDHLRKLEPATVRVLTERFEPVLRRFGYLD